MDEYTARQTIRDQQNTRQCAAWLEAMSPAQRAKAIELGIVKVEKGKDGETISATAEMPPEYITKDVCMDGDAAELFENSTCLSATPDMAASVDKMPDLLAEHFGLNEKQGLGVSLFIARHVKLEVHRATSLMLYRAVGYLLAPGNLLLRAHGMAHAARLAMSWAGIRSLRHSAQIISEKLGDKISVEAVRKAALHWIKLLELPPLENAKSDAAKESYRQDKLTNHWRNKLCTKKQMPPSSES